MSIKFFAETFSIRAQNQELDLCNLLTTHTLNSVLNYRLICSCFLRLQDTTLETQ